MGVLSTAYRHMVAAGMSPEAIAAALEEMESAAPPPGPQRTARQERNARYYAKRASEKRLKASETSNSDDQDATPPPKKVSPAPPSKNTPTLVSANADTPARDLFEDFWAAYPRRDGDNPKKPARQKFETAVRKGADPQAIIAGAKHLAEKHPTPTPYVPQAVTWLNQERWTDHVNGSTGPPVVHFPTMEELTARIEAERHARKEDPEELRRH